MKKCPHRLCVATAIVATVFVSFGSKAQDGTGTAPPGRGSARGVGQGGFGGTNPRSGGRAPTPLQAPSSAEMLATRFQATVYEVEASTNQAGALDAKTLARQAATPEMLLKALSGVAKTRIVHRIDQPVNVFSDVISIGRQVPVITGTQMTDTGQAINSVAFHNVGLMVQLSVPIPLSETNRNPPHVKVAAQLLTLFPEGVEIVPGQRAMAVRNVTLEQSELLTFDQPLVMLTVSTSSVERAAGPRSTPPKPAVPVVYVVRYLFQASGQGSDVPIAAVSSANASEPAKPATETSNEVLPAQFQATVYEVRAAADRVNALDAGVLVSQASSADSLLKALGESGTSRILYRLDQPVNVFSDLLQAGTNEPVVTGTTTSPTGQAMNSYRYQSLGVSVNLSAKAPSKETPGARTNVAMTIQFSTMTPDNVAMGLGQVSPPVVQSQTLQHSEPLEFGKPRVLLTVRPSSWGEQATPIVYVVRYLFSPPSDK